MFLVRLARVRSSFNQISAISNLGGGRGDVLITVHVFGFRRLHKRIMKLNKLVQYDTGTFYNTREIQCAEIQVTVDI